MKKSDILFDNSRPRIMGIINSTPDSFSDGRKDFQLDIAVGRAFSLAEIGVDVIDIGGESTRPGSDEVNVEEELRRVIPLIETISKRCDVPISIDTRKVDVAEEAINAGASILNDVGGLRDPNLAEFVAKKKIPVIIMHMKGEPKTMQDNPQYKDIIAEIGAFFDDRIAMCERMKIKKFIFDPGIGFGKKPEHNLTILKNLGKLKRPGIPLLVGHSNKAFIGKITGHDVYGRVPGTAAVSALAIYNGADILRVHDVTPNRDAALMAFAIKNEKVDIDA